MNGNVQTINGGGSSSGEAVPVCVASAAGQSLRFDARGSMWAGVPSGGVVGLHYYNLSTDKQVLDLSDAGVASVLVAGANVQAVPGGFEKSVSGNTWNSWFKSSESFDPNVEDFAVSVLVESITGTIREMIGLDDNPNANASYSSIDSAVYTVNKNAYRVVYEKGSATTTGAGDVAMVVGDRLGVRCEGGVITYYIDRNGQIIDLYTSSRPATVPLYFKAALNRGVGSSGHSKVTDVKWITATKAAPVNAGIMGPGAAIVSDSDIERLLSVGLEVVPGSLYSDLKLTRLVDGRFPATTSHDFVHGYSVNTAQVTGNI